MLFGARITLHRTGATTLGRRVVNQGKGDFINHYKNDMQWNEGLKKDSNYLTIPLLLLDFSYSHSVDYGEIF